MTETGERFWRSLTLREREILKAVCADLSSYDDVAASINAKPSTIKGQVQKIMDKAGMSTRFEVMAFCIANGIVECPFCPEEPEE